MTKTTLPSRNIQAGGLVALSHPTHSPRPGAPLCRSLALLQLVRSYQQNSQMYQKIIFIVTRIKQQINWPLSLYKVWGIRPPGLPPFLPQCPATGQCPGAPWRGGPPPVSFLEERGGGGWGIFLPEGEAKEQSRNSLRSRGALRCSASFCTSGATLGAAVRGPREYNSDAGSRAGCRGSAGGTPRAAAGR